MGKGDKKTRKGKITKGSYGNKRVRKLRLRKNQEVIQKPVIEKKAPAKEKSVPTKEKSVPTKVAEKKETAKKTPTKKVVKKKETVMKAITGKPPVKKLSAPKDKVKPKE